MNNKIVDYREEFDIIPATESKNRSPVIHVGHNLGIEVWCVKSVFMYCYANFFKLLQCKKEHNRLERYSRTALVLNPNISTFWNYRKKLIINGFAEPHHDLLLTKLVLSQKPKSVEALAHRRWVLKQQNSSLTANSIQNELKLCNQLSDRVKCNYHAWSHRQWVFSNIDFDAQLWLSEFRASDEWTKFHVSDHSGWHHRQFLLNQLQEKLSTIKDLQSLIPLLSDQTTAALDSPPQFYESLLNQDLRKNEDLILNFSAHESLWYHRRFILRKVVDYRSWDEDPFLDKCQRSSSYDSNQDHYMVHHRRWLSDTVCS